MIWFCIFIVTFFIAYEEHSKRYSLMKEYQKLKCEYDSQSKDSYMYFFQCRKREKCQA